MTRYVATALWKMSVHTVQGIATAASPGKPHPGVGCVDVILALYYFLLCSHTPRMWPVWPMEITSCSPGDSWYTRLDSETTLARYIAPFTTLLKWYFILSCPQWSLRIIVSEIFQPFCVWRMLNGDTRVSCKQIKTSHQTKMSFAGRMDRYDKSKRTCKVVTMKHK